MTHRFAVFLICPISMILATAACSPGGDTAQTADEQPYHTFDGAQPNEVKIFLRCRMTPEGPDLDIAIRPSRKTINAGQTVVWRLMPQSTPGEVTVRPSNTNHWPFSLQEYVVSRGQTVSTDATVESDADPLPYKYSVSGVCTLDGETLPVTLDPDVIVRGAGPRDTIRP